MPPKGWRDPNISLICAVPGCEKSRQRRRGPYCPMHTWRLKHHGDFDYVRVPPTPEERFFGHVMRDMDSGCWLWGPFVHPKTGYGMFSLDRKQIGAHRAAYILFVEDIPDGLQIDHLCRVRHCVNPAHLEVVTARENTRRSLSPAAANARKTHCPQGHPYSGENLYVVAKTGARLCRTCLRIHDRERTERLRAARAAS
jgi:hypothetical protein